MYSQPEDIMEKYNLDVEQITKGRGTFVCTTSQGVKLLTPFRASKERAEFLRVYYEYMNENGFVMEKIVPTAEGSALAEDDYGNRYLLKDMFFGSECSTKNYEEMKAAAAELAHYHNYAAQCALPIPEFMDAGKQKLLEIYERHTRELIKVRNYVRSRKKKNEFEQKFQLHYSYYLERAQEAVELLKNEASADEDCLLGHGDYNQHNVLHTHEGCQIVHFEQLEYNYAVADLANFLRKMMEKNNWRTQLGKEIIAAYNHVRPIPKAQYTQLYIMLCFPEKFWKIANHYSNSHKAWLSGRDLEKLEKVIAQEEEKKEFLQNLFHFS